MHSSVVLLPAKLRLRTKLHRNARTWEQNTKTHLARFIHSQCPPVPFCPAQLPGMAHSVSIASTRELDADDFPCQSHWSQGRTHIRRRLAVRSGRRVGFGSCSDRHSNIAAKQMVEDKHFQFLIVPICYQCCDIFVTQAAREF